jgi:hypothetical protein
MTERFQSWRNTAYAGLAFGVLYGLITAIAEVFAPTSAMHLTSLLSSIAAKALLFALLIGLFLRSPFVPTAGDITLDEGETIVQTGLANHFRNFEGRGGRLALTSAYLRFKPHPVNIQRRTLDIPRADIVAASPVRTFGIIPNGIAVQLASGRVERFAVNDRLKWLDALNARRT